ncbi:C4-dicarboxylate transporter DctM subunit [Clostridiales Family XIII bacterium PM5-7]
MSGLLLILIFVVMLFLNVPIMIALGVSSVGYCMFLSGAPMSMITNVYFTSLDSFTLIAIPFFMLAGDLMMKGGISKRLINLCRALIGGLTGSLGAVTIVASMIFAAVAGSGTATVACIGGITVPEMIKEKYDKGYACAMAATAGALGPIIPPSVAMILYGVACQVSITGMFLGGIIPGFLMAVGLIALNTVLAKKHNWGLSKDSKEIEIPPIGVAFKEGIWALMVPVIILGGIYGGIVTPTEAAVIACDYALIIGLFVYKEYKIKDIPGIIKGTVETTGTVMLLVACASALGKLLTIESIPVQLAEALVSISSNKIIILLIINVFLLFVGMFMETYAAIILLAPVLLPTVQAIGVDPLHFGLIMVVNLTIGLCTPPVGVNLFVASRIGGAPMEKMFKWLLPCLAVLLVVLLLVTFIPAVSMFLPNLFL